MFASQLNAELLGSPAVRGLRAELATVRALRANSASVEQAQLVLRGFRQAREQRPLARYLSRLQQSGPLESIRLEAVHVIAEVPPERYWPGDLRLLAAAADLLTQQEAALALDAVLESLQQGGPREGRVHERTAPSVLRENAWAAVADLAIVAQQQPRAGMALLQQLLESPDELGDAGLRRAAGQLDWEEMPAHVIEAWRAGASASGRKGLELDHGSSPRESRPRKRCYPGIGRVGDDTPDCAGIELPECRQGKRTSGAARERAAAGGAG